MSQEAIYPISNIHSISFKTRLILLPPPFHTSESECCWLFEHCRSHIPLVSSTQRYKIVDNMGFVRDGQSPPCHCLNGKTFKLLYFRYTSPCVKLFMQYHSILHLNLNPINWRPVCSLMWTQKRTILLNFKWLHPQVIPTISFISLHYLAHCCVIIDSFVYQQWEHDKSNLWHPEVQKHTK